MERARELASNARYPAADHLHGLLDSVAAITMHAPGNIAWRALSRLIHPDDAITPAGHWHAAAVLANGLRSLFNRPESANYSTAYPWARSTGRRYCVTAPLLTQAGATVHRPLAGLPFGEQLACAAGSPNHQYQNNLQPSPGSLGRKSRLHPPACPLLIDQMARAIVAAQRTYGREHQAERAGTYPSSRSTPKPTR
ncbi:hypothetical protein [Micromonospora humida]|uniref:hypothetical protein n=1 Tax=Micromonospora humida TaxID=2809018 RepID=UPI0034085D41